MEAELLAITSGTTSPKSAAKPKPKLIPDAELNKMVAHSLRDTYSDDEDEGSDGEDDPDLLSELQEITGDEIVQEPPAMETEEVTSNDMEETIKLIEKRISMYEIAEKNAKSTGEVARARRFNRGYKTLQDLLKQAKSGKSINMEDIPPEVSIKAANSTPDPAVAPSRPAPPVPKALEIESPTPTPVNEDIIFSPTSSDGPIQPTTTTSNVPEPSKAENETVKLLKERLSEYKKAALKAKKDGDKESALQFIKIVKQFDVVIKMAENGETVDLSDMPPPPDQLMVCINKFINYFFFITFT